MLIYHRFCNEPRRTVLRPYYTGKHRSQRTIWNCSETGLHPQNLGHLCRSTWNGHASRRSCRGGQHSRCFRRRESTRQAVLGVRQGQHRALRNGSGRCRPAQGDLYALSLSNHYLRHLTDPTCRFQVCWTRAKFHPKRVTPPGIPRFRLSNRMG